MGQVPRLVMGRVQVQLGPALVTPVVRGRSAAVKGQQRGSREEGNSRYDIVGSRKGSSKGATSNEGSSSGGSNGGGREAKDRCRNRGLVEKHPEEDG